MDPSSSAVNSSPPISPPTSKEVSKPSKQSDTRSKVIVAVGLIFTLACLAVVVTGYVDPSLLGPLSQKITQGAGFATAVSGIALLVFMRYCWNRPKTKEIDQKPLGKTETDQTSSKPNNDSNV